MASSSYANVTLTSLDGDLSAVVYLPRGIKPDEDVFYSGSRFEHGSMIGSIRRKVRAEGRKTVVHELFGTDMWRIPHNSNWPESGVGLAAEFGVGDDGAFCNYRCGWAMENDVTNGVLGYQEVANGESFLKIGVGELVKGSCPLCDSAEDYKFNSPYRFARTPHWALTETETDTVRLDHQAMLRQHGYKLSKEIRLIGNALTVTSTLTNLGADRFSTAWYSHNLFSCDGIAVGPGYSIDLNLRGDREMVYEEPGTWSWSTPLKDYAQISTNPSVVRVKMNRALDFGTRIKAEFTNDHETSGGYNIKACGTSVASSFPQVDNSNGVSMYGYNLYVERGALSPEPLILLNLDPGQAITWAQQLEIADVDNAPPDDGTSFQQLFTALIVNQTQSTHCASFLFGCAVVGTLVAWIAKRPTSGRRQYSRIPDHVTV